MISAAVPRQPVLVKSSNQRITEEIFTRGRGIFLDAGIFPIPGNVFPGDEYSSRHNASCARAVLRTAECTGGTTAARVHTTIIVQCVLTKTIVIITARKRNNKPR